MEKWININDIVLENGEYYHFLIKESDIKSIYIGIRQISKYVLLNLRDDMYVSKVDIKIPDVIINNIGYDIMKSYKNDKFYLKNKSNINVFKNLNIKNIQDFIVDTLGYAIYDMIESFPLVNEHELDKIIKTLMIYGK